MESNEQLKAEISALREEVISLKASAALQLESDNATTKQLREENERLHVVEQDWLKHDCGILMEENKSLRALISRLTQALEDIWNHAGTITQSVVMPDVKVELAFEIKEMARKALQSSRTSHLGERDDEKTK